jgi:hypothetical protein
VVRAGRGLFFENYIWFWKGYVGGAWSLVSDVELVTGEVWVWFLGWFMFVDQLEGLGLKQASG